MAAGVRFTAKEREWLVEAAEADGGKVALSILSKLLLSNKPKSVGLPLTEALKAFAEVLGNRLVLPPKGAGAIFGQMSNRLKALGLSRMDCSAAAKQASVEWRGPIKAESIIRQAETLLSNSQQELPLRRGSTPSRNDLEDL